MSRISGSMTKNIRWVCECVQGCHQECIGSTQESMKIYKDIQYEHGHNCHIDSRVIG